MPQRLEGQEWVEVPDDEIGKMYTQTSIFGGADLPDPFAKLPAICERLGVPAFDKAAWQERPKGTATWVIQTKDGRAYDGFDIITALLDRLDAAAK